MLTEGAVPTAEFWLLSKRARHVECGWFALCEAGAVKFRRHPVLGLLPVCDAHTVEKFGGEKR